MARHTVRQWHRLASSCALALLLCACADVSSVVPTGQGTYMVTAHGVMGWSSGGAQKARAFEAANRYCAAKGERMVPITTHETPSGFGKIAEGEVNFRCEAK